MSQRECAGFNAPRFSVGTGDEVIGVPITCLLNGFPCGRSDLRFIMSGDPYSLWPSLPVGVAQPLR
jgi:hypothetical protein